MIGYLRGQIIENTEGKLLVGMSFGSSSLGYSVSVPQSAAYDAFLPGKEVELYIYTHVREDVLDLYGFAAKADKELFLILLGVNGIGPKGALSILSKVSSDELIQYVLAGDKASLTQIPGIGKKTAERVVLELADPLRKKMEAGILGGIAANVQSQDKKHHPSGASIGDYAVFQDAKDALIGLGYREQDIATLLRKVLEESKPAPKRTEDLIRTALQRLSI